MWGFKKNEKLKLFLDSMLLQEVFKVRESHSKHSVNAEELFKTVSTAHKP